MPMKGKDKHLARLRKLASGDVQRVAGAVVFKGADTIRAEAFRLVSAGSVSGKNHVASAPGEAPNRDTGTLQAGFKTAQTGPVSAEFRSEADYASALEFGSSREAGVTSRSFSSSVVGKRGPLKPKFGPIKVEFGDSTTEARPHIRPARDNKVKQIRKRMVEQMNKLVQQSG